MIFYIVIGLALIRQFVSIPDSYYIPALDLLFLGPLTLVLINQGIKTRQIRVSLWGLVVILYLLCHALSLIVFGHVRSVSIYPAQELRLIVYIIIIAGTYRYGHLFIHWYLPKSRFKLTMSIFVIYGAWFLFTGTYRPAIMSESNYDATLIVGYTLSTLLLGSFEPNNIHERRGTLTLLAVSVINQSRTTILTALLTLTKNRYKFLVLIQFFLVAVIIFILYTIDFRGLKTFGLKSIDRILFLQVFWEISTNRLNLAELIFGWNIISFDNCFNNVNLNWYVNTQGASKELGCIVPANFHGLIPRLIAQYGLIGLILLYILPLIKLIKMRFFLGICYFVVAGLSQSFFYHAYAAGPLLLGIFALAKIKK